MKWVTMRQKRNLVAISLFATLVASALLGAYGLFESNWIEIFQIDGQGLPAGAALKGTIVLHLRNSTGRP